MPAKIFRIPYRVNKKISTLPKHIRVKINDSFVRLKENPISGIKLRGELFNYYKYRIGDYRIVYKFNSKKSIIEILKIEHRQGVYK